MDDCRSPFPSGVEVTIDGRDVTVKGPKGTLSHTVVEPITVSRPTTARCSCTRPDDERDSKARHGLTRTLVANMVIGVTEGYSKTLEIVGTGYRVQAKGSDLEFALGFCHPVTVVAPEGITFAVEAPTRFVVSRHRQAAGRRGRGQHPQDPQAGALQGQGRAVPGRSRPPQGRKGW